MNYRPLGKTNISVSEIGMGGEVFDGKDLDFTKAMFDEAFKQGINFFDLLMSEPGAQATQGKALLGRRKKAIIQGHICSTRKDGQYFMTRDISEIKDGFEGYMERMQTNYIDIGMLHFVDSDEDFDLIFGGEIIEYAKELKRKGIIRAIGFNTHMPHIAKRAVLSEIVDVIMFSLNPAFDLMTNDISLDDMFVNEKVSAAMQSRIDPARVELYQLCEQRGVAITVMKTYMAGRLLDAEQSPFGVAMTPSQCIHYALTRPGVASAIIGCNNIGDILAATAYNAATDAEKDFSEVFTKTFTAEGKCVYCNHCLPCPAHIDIGQVNKYLDLANATSDMPETVLAHYNALPKRAGDCIACGDCEKRCPFAVPIIKRMNEAMGRFGN